ncbi:Dihydrolipoyllysine-residue acetyltransferase component of acetoin cleaving system [Streptomyces malaysiensis subsp. malaysiensis]|uniref:alpha/beta fold hydrolase n=1 Tax=Streptomyces malaysiensis TaxID=92644 RepID=UPI000CA2F477|nr:alpha/beta hydrolase [Streptomyces sp. M56]AUA08780.1 Dihydrolipoyllysine-residue acetyltransferase component of acetoin cleaving system [Streptomyces sp. M56]
MPTAVLDGIRTRYEVTGDGPPLLMFSPGGFDSTLDSWYATGIHRRLRLPAHLAAKFTCVTFDRRESGRSGGRLERLTWDGYVRQGVALLDHLGFGRAYLMGGCVGCSTAAALAAAHPERVAGMVLYSPAGGVHYRRKQHERFERHLAFVRGSGLGGVVELARATEDGFSKDPRVGPWAAVLRHDADFASVYAAYGAERYRTLVTGSAAHLFDRDTVPGVEPEDLLTLDVPALIVPGDDTSHAPSAAHYLRECLPRTQWWGVPPGERTPQNTSERILEFLAGA